MPVDDHKLIQRLLDAELVTRDQIDAALSTATQHHTTLSETLVQGEFLRDEILGQVLADMYGVPFIRLDSVKIDEVALRIIPELVARNQLCIAYKQDGSGISIATAHPDNAQMLELIQRRAGEDLRISYATPADIRQALRHYRRGLEEEFSTLLTKHVEQAADADPEDLPIISIVDMLISYAYENHSSDIHLEPHEQGVVVRFRIDGILHDAATLPITIQDAVISRIKILSSLRTDEHRSAQDGRFQKKFEDEKVDIRVSIVPISEGEKVVMRLLSQGNRRFSLEDLGLGTRDLQIVQQTVKRPHGMILATGPTGSGKTTTLYAVVKLLNTRKVNISTIEDPVEYEIEGINQIQVDQTTNLTFAHGLRSILRQDPDIIMVGEIRDEETANIAINAAMTGHLVLSTLHTNDATTTLPRLLDMGIEPFLISSTINAAIGQRLVRKIHRSCIESYAPSPEDLKSLSSATASPEVKRMLEKKNPRLYRGKGCDLCYGTGYEGRIGIFEVLEITEEIRRLIMRRANSEEIRAAAIAAGMTTMFHDGVHKALQGLTTIEEVLRVTNE